MSKLIKLKDANGTLVYLNPAHVVLISGAADKDGHVILGASNVLLVGGAAIGMLGSPEEVSSLLNSPDSVHYTNLLS